MTISRWGEGVSVHILHLTSPARPAPGPVDLD